MLFCEIQTASLVQEQGPRLNICPVKSEEGQCSFEEQIVWHQETYVLSSIHHWLAETFLYFTDLT